MMKQKIFGTGQSVSQSVSGELIDVGAGAGMGRSCTSIDKPNKDEFWDGMTNPALSTSKEDINLSQEKEKEADVVASPPSGPHSIPLSSVVPEVNIQTRDHQIKGE